MSSVSPGDHDRVCRPEECHQLPRGRSTEAYNQGTERGGGANGSTQPQTEDDQTVSLKVLSIIKWRGPKSNELSSKFWKQVVYEMPAKRRETLSRRQVRFPEVKTMMNQAEDSGHVGPFSEHSFKAPGGYKTIFLNLHRLQIMVNSGEAH